MTDPIRTLLARVEELHDRISDDDMEAPEEFWEALDKALDLARALEAVLEVHQPFIWDFGYGPLESCKGCADQGAGDHDYPCPTIRAITEHLGGEE